MNNEAQISGAWRRPAAPVVAWRPAAPVVAMMVAVVLLMSGPAQAHAGDESYLYLNIGETSIDGRLEAPLVDLAEVLGLNLDGDNDAVTAELEANSEEIAAYLTTTFELGPEGDEWFIEFGQPSLFFSDEQEVDDNYAIIPFAVAVANSDVPREFRVRFDPFFDEVEGRSSHLLLIENDPVAGVMENGYETLVTFSPDNREATAELGAASVWSNLWASIKLGVNHIETGPDHVLFILVLLLPSVLVWQSGRWIAADTFGAAFWRILKIVTTFTLAHSITFSLAGLEIIPLPSPRIVESIIGLSIGAAALHNLRPIAPNREWLISFAFGLFHGLGFASLVSGMDVSRGTQLVSLLGRNIGIEIGQVIVVIVLFPILFLLRRLVVYRPLFVALSLFLTVVAVGWAIERAFELDFGTDRLVDPFFVYPEIFVAVAFLTSLAAIAHVMTDRVGKLLPTASQAVGERVTADPGDGRVKEATGV